MSETKKEESKKVKMETKANQPQQPKTPAEQLNQAISILIQGVEVAQKRGAFNLEEASTLSQAVLFFKSQSDKNQKEKEPKEDKKD